MSNEYIEKVHRRCERSYTLEEIGQRWAASGSASSVSPVTMDMAQSTVTSPPQAVDVPVSDDDMYQDQAPFQGESQRFEDEPDGEPDHSLQERSMGEEGGEEEPPEFDEEEDDWVHEYNSWIPSEDVTDEHVGYTHSRDHSIDRASFQRRRLNEDGDQSWDFRSGSASSTSRNPLSNPDTNDRHLKYDRWGYKEVEVKRQEEDEFAEKLKRHHQHPLSRK
eukprot:6456165-Amphidinium_carterae.1